MHSKYSFDFLRTISKQLIEELERLSVSPLDAAALLALAADQTASDTRQGVYLIHLAGQPVYLGKADDVAQRLTQHLRKLTGRQSVALADIGYKALLLDESMGTAANEDLLIQLHRHTHPHLWNGRGFGPKDPGKERDTTRPSYFDENFPIRDDFAVGGIDDEETVDTLLRKMKRELPFVFRYDIAGDQAARQKVVQLNGVPREARALLQAAVTTLGPGWKGVVLAYGMILYKTAKEYPFGDTILP